jgi:hypothetical protein
MSIERLMMKVSTLAINACWLGVWNLDKVDRLRAAELLHRPLDERRFSDSTASRDFRKEPAFAV